MKPDVVPGDDLWSVPRSAVPVDGDQLDDALFGVRDEAKPHGVREPTDSSDRRRRWPTGVALALAMLALAGLGLAGLGNLTMGPPDGQDKPSDSGLSTVPSVSASPPKTQVDPQTVRLPKTIPWVSSAADFVIVGPVDCPMRLTPDRNNAWVPSIDQPNCFFID